MREIAVDIVKDTVARLCKEANVILPNSLCECLKTAVNTEVSPLGQKVLRDIVDNFGIAKAKNLPVCQDTGMAVIFAEVGQDIHFTGGLLTDAINQGVSLGYTEGFLRASVVNDPILRVNTEDNTPAVIHIDLVRGDQLRLTVCPKGFGSENMSEVRMLTPAASFDDIVDNAVDVISNAGSKACPPMVVGVGIGGNFEQVALFAKKALGRDVSIRHPLPLYAEMENRILTAANRLGVGPQGFGGSTTVLAVNVIAGATHIAGLPMAVNIGCHVTRHATACI